MDLIGYLDAARARAGLASDRQLAGALGLSQGAVFHFRHRRAFPADDVMIRLAQLAGVEPERALLDLNIWRTEGTPAASFYRQLLMSLSTAAAILLSIVYSPPASSMDRGSVTENYTLCDLWL